MTHTVNSMTNTMTQSNIMTEHEDIELGRCVRHHVGIGCTTSFEMENIFKNNYKIPETDKEQLKPLFESVAINSATYHANKQSVNQYRLHYAIIENKIKTLIEYTSILQSQTEMDKSYSHIELDKSNKIWDQIYEKNHYSTDATRSGIILPYLNFLSELETKIKEYYNQNGGNGYIRKTDIEIGT